MSVKLTRQLQREFEEVLNGIRCFDGTFSLQVKPNSKLYQAPIQWVAYALQKAFEKELKTLQQQDMMTPLVVDETQQDGTIALNWCLNRWARSGYAWTQQA